MAAWIPALAGLVGVLVGAGTFWLAAWKQRRDYLEQRVQSAVKGEVGERFLDFIEAGDRFEAKVQSVLDETTQESARIIDDARESLRSLEDGQQVALELTALLERASIIMPGLQTLQSAMPAELVRELDDRQTTTARAQTLVDLVGESTESSSKQLERAGDKAKELLEDFGRARNLYARACEVDPGNVSAQAELLGIDLRNPAERDAANEKLMSLIVNYPWESNAIAVLMNDYVQQNRYKEMAEAIKRLLVKLPESPLLRRNLGLALSHSGGTHEDIMEAYEQALELARSQGTDTGDFVNTAKAYIVWLGHVGRIERAHEVLEEATWRMPEEASLYLASYRLALYERDADRAKRSLKAFASLTGLSLSATVDRLNRGLAARDYLESGISDGSPSDPATPESIAQIMQQLMQADPEGEQ